MKEIIKNPKEKDILYTISGSCYHQLIKSDIRKNTLEMLERTKYLFKASEHFVVQLTALEPAHTNKFCTGPLELILTKDYLYLIFKNEIEDHMCRKNGIYECPFSQIKDIKIETRKDFSLISIYFTDKWDYRLILKATLENPNYQKIKDYIFKTNLIKEN